MNAGIDLLQFLHTILNKIKHQIFPTFSATLPSI